MGLSGLNRLWRDLVVTGATRRDCLRRLVLTTLGGLVLGELAACSTAPQPVASPIRVATTDGPPAIASATTLAPTRVPPTRAATVPPVGPPYVLRETTVRLVDRSRPTTSRGRVISPFRTLITLVWLPAAPGQWPLVVFAHGFDVGPQTYASLLETWAAHGYVVAGPEFPLTDPAVAGSNLDENDINNQPTDLRFVTDSLIAPASPVAAHIDQARVAVAGHSDGAESALAASLAPAPAGEGRYRAVIVMSGQPVPGLGAMTNPPILVTQGDADTINAPVWGLETWQQAAPPKYFLDIHGGGHLPPLQAGSTWLPGIEAASMAFLDAYVAADKPASDIAAAVSRAPLLSLRSG